MMTGSLISAIAHETLNIQYINAFKSNVEPWSVIFLSFVTRETLNISETQQCIWLDCCLQSFFFILILNKDFCTGVSSLVNISSTNLVRMADKIDELMERLRKDGIKFVRFESPNILGQAAGMLVPARNCEQYAVSYIYIGREFLNADLC